MFDRHKQNAAPNAPDTPNVLPVTPLVELTATL